MAIVEEIGDFRDSFETISWLYLLFKCEIKTKTHFEWLLWHWSSLGQLNLEPTRPNGLLGCKVPTDLVKISVKEATHMVFHYNRCWDQSWSMLEKVTLESSFGQTATSRVLYIPYICIQCGRVMNGYLMECIATTASVLVGKTWPTDIQRWHLHITYYSIGLDCQVPKKRQNIMIPRIKNLT